MQVGKALLSLARATGLPSLFFVGTGKNVGKTVAMRAVYDAACLSGLRCGVTSIGRDGEAVDVADSGDKPRLYLQPGTVLATAADVLPASPASELLELSRLRTAAGTLIYARVRSAAHYELIGPPTASGTAAAVTTMLRFCDYAIVDGAVDRVAALAATPCAVVVACGAAGAATMDDAVADVSALVARLRIPEFSGGDSVRIDGALTPAAANALIAAREARPVVVADPTRFVLSGRAATTALARLNVFCERPFAVVGVTIASIGREQAFEPRAFAQRVAASTGLPVFDVYAGHAA